MRRAVRPTRDGRLAMLWLATFARLTYNHAEADAYYGRLVGDRATEPDILRKALVGYGQGRAIRWQADQAVSLLEQAATLARTASDSLSEGEAVSTLASIQQRWGQVDSARRLFDRAAQVTPQNSGLAAGRLCSQGSSLRGSSLNRGDSLVVAGLAQARALGDSVLVARCMLSQATIFEARGYQGQGMDVLRDATKLARNAGDQDLLATLYQWRAFTNVSYGESVNGTRILADSAIRIARRVGNPVTEAWARLSLAQVAMRVGDASLGYRAATEAGLEFRRMRDAQGEVSALSVSTQALALSGRVRESIASYVRLEALSIQIGAANAVPYYQIQRATGYLRLGLVDSAVQLIDSAAATSASRNLVGLLQANVPYARGLVGLRRGRYDDAIEAFSRFQRAIRASTSRQFVDADLRIAEAFSLSQRFAQAESVFAVVNAKLDRLRERTPNRDDVVRLLAGQRFDPDTDLGIATIVHALATNGRGDAAFGVAESERARWLWTLRARRNAAARQARNDAPLDDRQLAFAEVQRALDAQTAVVAYVTGRGGEPSTAFVIWKDGARAVGLPSVDSLSPMITRLVSMLESDGGGNALASSLGTMLLGQVVPLLPPGVTHLRVVPDGALHHVPFDALMLPNRTRVLERFVLTISPSARLAVAPSRGKGGPRVLVFGDPVFEERFALPRLPGSAIEATTVLQASRGLGEVLLRERARADALQGRDWSGVGAVHLATHARVQDWGLLDNAIFLSKGPSDDGRVEAADLVVANLDVDLVVLSACRTARGLVVTGEGAQGLVAPVLEAGARAVAVTHWNVRDRSLTPLMQNFYAAMARGARADDALAAAKRTALKAGLPTSTWAAMTLVGDGEVRPLVPNASRRSATAVPNAAWSRPRGSPLRSIAGSLPAVR